MQRDPDVALRNIAYALGISDEHGVFSCRDNRWSWRCTGTTANGLLEDNDLVWLWQQRGNNLPFPLSPGLNSIAAFTGPESSGRPRENAKDEQAISLEFSTNESVRSTVIEECNRGAITSGQPPLFSNPMTRWGFDVTKEPKDWDALHQALSLAKELSLMSEGVVQASEVDAEFEPVVARVPIGSDLSSRIGAALGMREGEWIEIFGPVDNPFFGQKDMDEIRQELTRKERTERKKIAKFMQRELKNLMHISLDSCERSDVYSSIPHLFVGELPGNYLVGLWTYVVRT